MATYRNALGQIDPYKSDWTSGSWSGTIDPGAVSNGLGSDSVSPTGFQYNPLLGDWWNQQGFQGNAFQTGQGDARFDQPQMTPELQAWAAANGYAPGFTEGYGGILKNGQIQPGTAQGNRTNDDAMMIAALLAGGVVGSAAYGAAGAAGTGAGEAAGGAAGAAGWEVPLAESAQLPAEFGGFQNVGAAAGEAGAASSPLLPMGAEAGVGALPSVPAVSGTAASGGGWGSLASGLGDFFSGNGSASDYARAAQTLAGLYTTNRATDAAQQGAADQNALIREAMAKNQPLIDTRNNALVQINGLMADPSSITKDPGYQFGLNQGQRQIDNQAAARGGYYSGQQLKASQQFGQDYAGTKLDQTYNRLLGAAGLGQQGGTANTNLSLNLGQNAATQGNIRGSGYIGMGNTLNNGLGGFINDWTNRKAWGEPG